MLVKGERMSRKVGGGAVKPVEKSWNLSIFGKGEQGSQGLCVGKD